MVDHFTDLTYVNPMRSTNQEETLAGKASFERKDFTCEVKIKMYHTYNGIFSEKSFRSTIEDAKHTIKFCRVGSHHKNVIVEKNQTLTLGARTLILHAKKNWPDAITKMLWPYALKDSSEQLNVIKVDGYGITTMENFVGTTIDITFKNHHTWGCPIHILYALL